MGKVKGWRRVGPLDLPLADVASQVAHELGLPFHLERPGSDSSPPHKIWLDRPRQLSLSLVDDLLLGQDYLEFRGYEEEAPAGALTLPQALARVGELVRDFAQALAEWRGLGPEGNWVRAVRRAAITSQDQPFDLALLGLMEQALAHPQAEVRRAAVQAVAYVDWPELYDPLSELSRDPECGQEAAAMLEAMLAKSRRWQLRYGH